MASENTLTLRRQERAALEQRIRQTDRQITDLSDRLMDGLDSLSSSQWDALLAQYNAALRRKEADEERLHQLNSKAKLTDEERERTQKKMYQSKYKY